MDLIYSVILLPFVLSELESKPLPLGDTGSFFSMARSPNPAFQIRLQRLSLASLHARVPSFVPGRNSNPSNDDTVFVPKCQETQQHVCVLGILVCAACSVCFSLLLPSAWLHWTVWCSKQHNTENNTGTYLSCQCLLMHFWMVLGGSVCYLFVQWPKEEQCCCCLHESSRDPAC